MNIKCVYLNEATYRVDNIVKSLNYSTVKISLDRMVYRVVFVLKVGFHFYLCTYTKKSIRAKFNFREVTELMMLSEGVCHLLTLYNYDTDDVTLKRRKTSTFEKANV